MRNFFFPLTVFILGCASLAYAQNDGGFGLKVGLGLSTLNIENNTFEEAKSRLKVGGMLGVTYEKRFGEGSFALDIEALIANKGSQQKQELIIGNNKLKYTLRNNIYTVDLPVSAKFYIGDNFNIYAGPYVSYIFAARLQTIVNNNSTTTIDESEDWFNDDFKDANGNYPLNRWDAGVNFGLEFVTNKGFGIGTRLNQGFLDITNNDYNKVVIPGAIELKSDKKTFNTTLQVYALIRF